MHNLINDEAQFVFLLTCSTGVWEKLDCTTGYVYADVTASE